MSRNAENEKTAKPNKWQVMLPWPARELSPNARGHWAKKSTAAKRYRHTCKIKTLQEIQASAWDVPALRELVEAGGRVHLFIDFYPPDRRHRDDDNVIASFKSGRDGLADALKIDDSKFRIHPFLDPDKPVKGGGVWVTVTGHTPSEGESK